MKTMARETGTPNYEIISENIALLSDETIKLLPSYNSLNDQ